MKITIKASKCQIATTNNGVTTTYLLAAIESDEPGRWDYLIYDGCGYWTGQAMAETPSKALYAARQDLASSYAQPLALDASNS